MKMRKIGSTQVSAIGLGAMPMSVEGRPDEERSIATIHAALDAGVTLIDTADAYHLGGVPEVGHNELLIARALSAYGGDVSGVLVATKGGHLRPEPGPRWLRKGDPAYLKEAAKASAKRLGVEAIGLYQLHKPDPEVPYADSVGALADLLDEGVILMGGISNVYVDQILEADAVLGGRLASVQNQYSPGFRAGEPELALCEEREIAFLAWGPLGGISSAQGLASRHKDFAAIGREQGVSAQVVALAWELARSEVVIPLPGASRPMSIRDSATAPDLALTRREMERLDASLEHPSAA